MRVLFLTPSPIEAAGTRYRVHQYIPYLHSRGFECEIAPFLSREMFCDLYQSGRVPKKVFGLTRAVVGRLSDVIGASRYDVVCISREAMLFGPPVVEWLLQKVIRRPIVFDFDDAIYVSYVSPTYGRFASWLKYPAKSAQILALSTHIIAGNQYLAKFARQHNRRVTIVPTVVDTEKFSEAEPAPHRDERPVIGWIGSHSTAQYLDMLTRVMQQLAINHEFVFRVTGACRKVSIPGVEVENRDWNLETEICDFRGLDIGVYPIRDDEWARGKCAFKAIQYMAAGVPCVASPVGMTTEVIKDGINGLLADSFDEWVTALGWLLKNAEARQRMISEGIRTVEERYSLHVHAPRFAEVLQQAAEG